jgi:hypothetical protein
MSKYQPLRRYLEGRGTESVPMSFAEIEKVIGFKLPESQKYPAWWSNNPTNNVMTNEWLAAGYKTEQVDIEGRKLVFRRTRCAAGGESNSSQSGDGGAQPRRHRLLGWMKGMVTIMPDADLTEPADPHWADIAWGKETKLAPGKDDENEND